MKTFRTHHWVKNLLIFAPLITAHQLFVYSKLKTAALAFAAFCAVSSSMYIINDILDRESDKKHPQKSKRPIASGEMSILYGSVLAIILLIIAFAIGSRLPKGSIQVLASYSIITVFYSLYLKKVLLLDVICLASLYLIRILSGGIASGIIVSEWFMAFSLFLFFGLAVLKRTSELKSHQDDEKVSGRGYFGKDAAPLLIIGVVSHLLSILVFVLYINSSKVASLYTNVRTLWFIVPFLLYWYSRIWVLTNRGKVSDDLIAFLEKDIPSYISILCILSIICIAT